MCEFPFAGRYYSPPEISAMMLQYLKGMAEDFLNEQVKEAISQFRPILTIRSARLPKMPGGLQDWKSAESSTSLPRRHLPMAWARKSGSGSRSLIWAAERSISPFSN